MDPMRLRNGWRHVATGKAASCRRTPIWQVCVVLAAFLVMSSVASAQSLAADVDDSGRVDSVDIQLVINAVLTGNTAGGNVDGQGGANAIDIQIVINFVLNGVIDLPVGPVVYGYQVEAAYPHDVAAFTQGLVIDNGVLYEGTGLYGQSTLRRVDLATGAVLQSRSLPFLQFGEGITVIDDRIIQLTWRAQVGYVYNKFTFEELRTFGYSSEGWGITTVGDRLIMSDGTPTLRWLDPNTFAVTDEFNVRDGGLDVQFINELEYFNGEIWANIWLTDRIVRIDPVSGQVVGSLNMTGLLPLEARTDDTDVLNGIAYDHALQQVYVTGKLWPFLYAIDVFEL